MRAVLRSGALIRELDASAVWPFNEAQWMELLAHPSLQRIHTLRLRDGVSASVMAVIARLPFLQTLSLRRFAAPAAAELLPSLPALTRLHLVDEAPDSRRIPVQRCAVQRCAKLLHLEVRHPALVGSSFLAFFGSPHMSQLQSIKLHYLPEAAFADYAAGFSALSSLHTLHLARCYGVNGLLPHLVHASSLRFLTLQPNCVVPTLHSVTSVPDASVLHALLVACPSLRCALLLSREPNTEVHKKIESMQRCCVDYLYAVFEADQPLTALGARFHIQKAIL